MAEQNGEPIEPKDEQPPVVPWKALRIQREYPADLKNVYSNHVIVQRSEHEYFLAFFETVPPDVFGYTPEEIQEKLAESETISAKCVARIVVPKSLIGSIHAAIGRVMKTEDEDGAEAKNDSAAE